MWHAGQDVWNRTSWEVLVCSEQVKKDKRSHLGGALTEKTSVIYMTAKQQEAKSLREEIEKNDATGSNAMFGDDDMNFDLQLEQFGVNTNALKEPATERMLRAWVRIGKKILGPKIIQLQRHTCSTSIKFLSF
jgi:hypothetical protein